MDGSEAAPAPPAIIDFEDTPSIGYVCPLYTELAAVLATFDESLGVKEIDDDDYYYGRIGSRMAVAVQFLYGEMGPQAASRCADRLVKAHPNLIQPHSICLLVGIAGGIWTEDRDIRLGDAVIATKIWNWRDGKQTETGLETTNFPENVSRRLRRKLPSFLYDRDALGQSIAQRIELMRGRDRTNDLRWMYPGEENDRLYVKSYQHVAGTHCAKHDSSQVIPRPSRYNELPKVHDGLVASGNVVLKDAKSRDFLHDKRVYAVEMEACGVPSDFFVVRGISDYADSHKNDIWQPYAAATAAACARLLVDHFVATAYQDVAQLHRLGSYPSNAPSMNQSRHDSLSSLTLARTESESTQQPYHLRATKSDVVLPTTDHVPSIASVQLGAQTEPNQATPEFASRPDSQSSAHAALKLDEKVANNATRVAPSTVNTIQAQQLATHDMAGLNLHEGATASTTRTSTQSLENPAADQIATKVDSASSASKEQENVCYSGLWKRATFKLFDGTKTPPAMTREHTWQEPRVTLLLQKANPAYQSLCFMTFTVKEAEEGLQDRVWLPLTGLRVIYIEGQVSVVFDSFMTTDNPLRTSVSLATGPLVRWQILLDPLATSDKSQNLLIEQLVTACRCMVSGSDVPKSILDPELAHETIKIDENSFRRVLYVHQLNAPGCHFCTLIAFTPKLDFRCKSAGYVEVHLKKMQMLQYSGVKEMLMINVKRDDAFPAIKAAWVDSREVYKIWRPLGLKSLSSLLHDTIGQMAGWTCINFTEGVSLLSFRDRSVSMPGSSWFGKGIAAMQRKLSGGVFLTVWQKGDAIRVLMYSAFLSDDDTGQWDGWDIKAGRGEILLPKDSKTKWKIAFELDVRSREGDYIDLNDTNWFGLPESHRVSCGDSISIAFPNAESHTLFQQSIESRFWRR